VTLIFNAMYLLKKLKILNILLYCFNFHNVYVKQRKNYIYLYSDDKAMIMIITKKRGKEVKIREKREEEGNVLKKRLEAKQI